MFMDQTGSTELRNDTTFDQVWHTDIWNTTSTFFTVRQFEQLRQVSPIERNMCSIDCPFSADTDWWTFVEEFAQAQVFTDAKMGEFA
jgi:hypothetical protein